MKRKELAAELRKLLVETAAHSRKSRENGDDAGLVAARSLGYLETGVRLLAERLEWEDAYGRTGRPR